MNHAAYKRVNDYGVGGRNCPCCGPAPRHRPAYDRSMKHREKRFARNEIRQELQSMRDEGLLVACL